MKTSALLLFLLATSASAQLRRWRNEKCKITPMYSDNDQFQAEDTINAIGTSAGDITIRNRDTDEIIGVFGEFEVNAGTSGTAIVTGYIDFFETVGDPTSPRESAVFFIATTAGFEQNGGFALTGGVGEFACATGTLQTVGFSPGRFNFDMNLCGRCV